MANLSGSKLNIFSWYELTDDATKSLWSQNPTVTCKLGLKLSRMHTIHIRGLPLLAVTPKPTAHNQNLISANSDLFKEDSREGCLGRIFYELRQL